MKDLLLVAINAKYSHTNLAVRYLRNALKDREVELLELSINDSIHQIMSHLLESKTRVYGFSCYIWNIELVFKITELLKKARPEALILLGGPEVTFESKKILIKHPFIDCIVTGNGELKLVELMRGLKLKVLVEGVYYSQGLKDRMKSNVIDDCPAFTKKPVVQFIADDFSSPYSEKELSDLKNRMIYYETMRGCPYRCSYCLSSLEKKLVLKPLPMVFKEIDLFFKVAVKQVKLVDRTFNCRPERALEIFNYIIAQAKRRFGEEPTKPLPNFHFEMTGDQISSEMMKCLAQAPKGLIQLEIGIQTTNQKTLKAIDRPIDFEKTKDHVSELLKAKNIHLHLDLIAGLPYETYAIFANSFNEVILLKPDMLQLGFLKGLDGTKIKNEAHKHEYLFASFAPYEIIRNTYLSAEELYLLRDIETLLDRFYNSGFFSKTIDILFFSDDALAPFEFFDNFARYWRIKGYFDRGISKEDLYVILHHYLKDEYSIDALLRDCLSYDYLKYNQLKEPGFSQIEILPKEAAFEFLKEAQNRQLYLPEFSDWAAKKIYPQIKIIKFSNAFYKFLCPEALFKVQQHQEAGLFLLMIKQGKSQLINI